MLSALKDLNGRSLASLYTMGTRTPQRYFVVKNDGLFVVADSEGKVKSKFMSPIEFRLARRHALTALEADPENLLGPELQALIWYQGSI